MAGKRQHFIPRFLLEGFASHKSADEVFTWVYRSDRPPFNTNTRNAGVEGMFYSLDEDSEADHRITREEGPMSALVAELRGGASAEPRRIAELIAHFEIRTRHLRQNFSATASNLVHRMLDPATQPFLLEHLVRRLSSDPELIKDAIAKELRKAGLPDTATETIYQVVRPLLPTMVPTVRTFMPIVLEEMRRRLPEVIPAAVKQGHLRVLREDVAPGKRVARYAALPYHIAHIPGADLPLGDSIVFFQLEDATFRPFVQGEGPPGAVILPLAKDVVAIGGEVKGDSSPATFARAIARCSLEFFVSASNSASFGDNAAQIGADSALLSDEEMRALIENALA